MQILSKEQAEDILNSDKFLPDIEYKLKLAKSLTEKIRTHMAANKDIIINIYPVWIDLVDLIVSRIRLIDDKAKILFIGHKNLRFTINVISAPVALGKIEAIIEEAVVKADHMFMQHIATHTNE